MHVRTFVEADAGCYLDSHRGHYISRDMVLMAADEFGYILSPIDRWFLDCYEDHSHEEGYPAELVQEIADKVLDWLNGGPNTGVDRAIKGQNSPPIIPESHAWAWWEGDFGLYPIDQISD